MSELAVLQGLRMKGRAAASLLAEITGLSRMELDGVLEAAIDTDLVVGRGSAFRLTVSGRKRLDELLAAERRRIDLAALKTVYPAFTIVNAELKETIAAWQLRDGVPNDHSDTAYDAAAIARLMALNCEAASVFGAITAVVPRLTRYVARLEIARARIATRDYSYVVAPTVDSYHQVWFELHEELITLLGLSRQGEDASGG
jgi:hypothetical protein